MNKHILSKLLGVLFLLITVCGSDSFAEPEIIKPITVDPLREALAGRAPFPSTIDMKPLQTFYERLKSLTESRCPVDAIINLKNPFLTALPMPERPIEEVKPPVDVKLPMLPPPVSDKGGKPVSIPKPSFKIQGVVWDTDFPQAIVNNEVVSVGDQVSGWTVIEINPQGVQMGIDRTNVYWFAP